MAHKIQINACPGQDEFHMPNLHTANNIATCLQKVQGDFTFRATCHLISETKFDAAGLYFKCGQHHLKFGIEHYGNKQPRLISVKSSPYSDEVVGTLLDKSTYSLCLSRTRNIISCYSGINTNFKFERAFSAENLPISSQVGFFSQAPFAIKKSSGIFTELYYSPTPTKHFRG